MVSRRLSAVTTEPAVPGRLDGSFDPSRRHGLGARNTPKLARRRARVTLADVAMSFDSALSRSASAACAGGVGDETRLPLHSRPSTPTTPALPVTSQAKLMLAAHAAAGEWPPFAALPACVAGM